MLHSLIRNWLNYHQESRNSTNYLRSCSYVDSLKDNDASLFSIICLPLILLNVQLTSLSTLSVLYSLVHPRIGRSRRSLVPSRMNTSPQWKSFRRVSISDTLDALTHPCKMDSLGARAREVKGRHLWRWCTLSHSIDGQCRNPWKYHLLWRGGEDPYCPRKWQERPPTSWKHTLCFCLWWA